MDILCNLGRDVRGMSAYSKSGNTVIKHTDTPGELHNIVSSVIYFFFSRASLSRIWSSRGRDFFFLWTLPTACYHYHSWIQTRHIKYDTGASISRGWIFISEQVEMKSRIRWWTILFPDLISIQKAKLKNGTKESLPGSANTDRKWLHKSFTASHLKPGVLMPQSIIYLLIDFSIKDGH